MKIVDKSVHITKFSKIPEGTVFKLYPFDSSTDYLIKTKSVYDGENKFYRNAINLNNYKPWTVDQACDVYPYYDVTLLIK